MILRLVSLVVYALLPGQSAEDADDELRRGNVGGLGNAAQIHRRAPLDANMLPDGATEYGRNLRIAIVAGAIVMSIAGGVAGAMHLVLGLSTSMGILLGAVTGALMGLVGAMQAGTRVAKESLLQLEKRLVGGNSLLVIEVGSRREADQVTQVLQRHDPMEIDIIGGW